MVVSTVECISGFISLFSVYSQESIGRCPWREGVMLLRIGGLAKAPLGEDLPAFRGVLTIKKQSYLGSRSMMPIDKEPGKKLTALEGLKKSLFFFFFLRIESTGKVLSLF